MEDNLKKKKKGRRPKKMRIKDDLKKNNGRRPKKKGGKGRKWKMEDDLQRKKPRRHKKKLKDDLKTKFKIFQNGRRPHNF